MVHEAIYNKLRDFCKSNRVPHTIFHGAITSKKESIVKDFLKMIYIDESRFAENVMFVNCAHGKGIKFTRDEIKFFAKTNTQPGIAFKSIVLVNADHLTIDAQSALRRCIEQYSNHTRFFIIVEDKNRLLTPILSRFCEIYIPSIEETNTAELSLLDRNTLYEDIDTYLNKYKIKEDLIYNMDITKTVDDLYENAFCCKDIINWVQKQKCWSSIEKANVGMLYHKIHLEYRNEKLLMATVLSFLCDDPLCDLKEISFM